MALLNLTIYAMLGNIAVYQCAPVGMIVLLWRNHKVAAVELVLFALTLHFTGPSGFILASIVRILALLVNGARKYGQPFTGILVSLVVPPFLLLMLSPT